MKHYMPLWALLATALLVFFAFSLWADDDIEIGALSIKRSKIADSLLAAANDVDTLAIADTIAIAEPIAAKQAVEVDTVRKTILFIGDSMLEGLYPRLAAYCQESGHKLYAVIWYSSTSEIWGKNTLITKYVNQLHPDYIFVCLGANELFVSNIIEKRDKYVKHMLAEIGDIPYLWIGPPNWKPDTGINELIEKNVPEGSFFLTNGMKFDRKKDGAHPTPESAIEWMDSVVRWMPLHSNHPILLNTPETETARAAKVYMHKPGDTP